MIIAEPKICSPFEKIDSPYTEDELFELAFLFGDVISIHTDERWGGSFEKLKAACKRTNKPVLAKGIHASDDDIQRAVDCGATYVLCVGRIPSVHLERCWIEPLSLEELSRIDTNQLVVWNQRDLQTGKKKVESFDEARKMFKGWLCQASLIQTWDDIDPRADAVLIGTHLPNFIKMPDILQATRKVKS